MDQGRIALIERTKHGRRYYAIPGGGVEPRETVAQAAEREAREELGVELLLGSLRVRIDHRERDGTTQRQWYFDAALGSDDVRFDGPEAEDVEGNGTFKAVWVPLEDVPSVEVLPAAVADLIVANRGRWPGEVVEIDER